MRAVAVVAFLALPTLSALPTSALAGTCEAYPHSAWRADMDAVDVELAEVDVQGARRALGTIQTRVRCLDQIARPDHLARLGRQVAWVFWFDQDLDQAQKWGLLAKVAAPTLPWPAGVAADDAFRVELDRLTVPPTGGPEGVVMKVPAKGAAFANGQLLDAPVAPAEVPVLVQITDARGGIVQAWWQDGAAFPPSQLSAEPYLGKAPKWWTGPAPIDPSVVGSALAFRAPERPALPVQAEPAPAPAPIVEPAPQTPSPEEAPAVQEPAPEYESFEYVE